MQSVLLHGPRTAESVLADYLRAFALCWILFSAGIAFLLMYVISTMSCMGLPLSQTELGVQAQVLPKLKKIISELNSYLCNLLRGGRGVWQTREVAGLEFPVQYSASNCLTGIGEEALMHKPICTQCCAAHDHNARARCLPAREDSQPV
jgi:hypothetical protein